MRCLSDFDFERDHDLSPFVSTGSSAVYEPGKYAGELGVRCATRAGIARFESLDSVFDELYDERWSAAAA